MRPSLLLGRRTSGVGIWSGAGSVHRMDISSNTPKIHGRILWANPVTISHFLCVPHYYWGAGRPEWVLGTIPTTAPCSPSGWQFYLYVGYRSTLVQSLNQYRIDLWLYDTFLHNRKFIFVLSCYSNTQKFLMRITGIQQISVPSMTYFQLRGPYSSIWWLFTTSNSDHRFNHTNHTSPVYIYMGLFSWFQSHKSHVLQHKWVLNMTYIH